MRIAFNGLGLTPHPTGIRRASMHTLQALRAHAPDAELVVFLPHDAPREWEGEQTVRTRASLDRPLESTLGEELILRGAKFDVSYSPSYLLPRIPGARAEVVCVHDLAPRFRDQLRARLPHAARVVCPSGATAERLADEFDTPARVVPPAVDADRFRPGPCDESEPFVAVVGSAAPPARIDTILEAFPVFRARMRPCRLVVVGGRPQRAGPAVDFVDTLGDEGLAELYRRALMVVQPAHYEGFDLPLLEAMACGTPVACADTPFFREVTDGCARFFDPKDARSIADTMAALAKDEAARADLSRRGPERARAWGWDRTARALWSVFEEAAA